MAITVSVGNQKGGCGKTTTTALISWLLANEFGKKVLTVDFDSQGNLTQILTRRNIYDFEFNTALEAVLKKDVRPFIFEVSDKLHIVPAEDKLATLSRVIYNHEQGFRFDGIRPTDLLKTALSHVQDDYDYIMIDLPPNLGDQTTNGLSAADFAVVILQSDPFCYNALERYLDLMTEIQKQVHPDLKLCGIVPSLVDSRASIDAGIVDSAREDYEEFVFNTVIRRRTRIKEFCWEGITLATKADRDAMEQYISLTKELLKRVEG